MSWVAVGVGVASTIGGGIMGSKASDKAAKERTEAAKIAAAESRDARNQAVGLNLGSINAGNNARSQLMSLLGMDMEGSTIDLGNGMYSITPEAKALNGSALMDRIKSTPGYDFMLKEGTDSVMQNMGALGLRGSGEAMRGLSDYTSQSVAMPAYESYLNRLANLSGIATNAANATGNTVINAGRTAGEYAIQAGDARASGIIGEANTWNNVARDVSGTIADWYSNKPKGGGGGGGGDFDAANEWEKYF